MDLLWLVYMSHFDTHRLGGGSDMPEWRKQLNRVTRPDAGMTEEFETSAPPAWRSKRQQKRTIQGRFLGCLLGGAVGDALGAPVEFMKRTEILRRFGPKGITQYAPAYGGLGTITDDTQMTLFTAEGLIRGWVRGCFKGITTYSGVMATPICAGCKLKANALHATSTSARMSLVGCFSNAHCTAVAHRAIRAYRPCGR